MDGHHTLNNYIIGKDIGFGTFSRVKVATHSQTGQKFAVKILDKANIANSDDAKRMSQEISILKGIKHPNIVAVYEIIETTSVIYIVMEYLQGGELSRYIHKCIRLEEREACRLFAQMISALDYLHKKRIVHRDIKPENLLLDQQLNLRMIDFGLSSVVKGSLHTFCGSPCFAAPEVILGKKYDGIKADIWSCGVTLFNMVCGYLPFEGENHKIIYKKIFEGHLKVPAFLSTEIKDLLSKVLKVNPQNRTSIASIYTHDWIKKYNTENRYKKKLLDKRNQSTSNKLSHRMSTKQLNLNKRNDAFLHTDVGVKQKEVSKNTYLVTERNRSPEIARKVINTRDSCCMSVMKRRKTTYKRTVHKLAYLHKNNMLKKYLNL